MSWRYHVSKFSCLGCQKWHLLHFVVVVVGNRDYNISRNLFWISNHQFWEFWFSEFLKSLLWRWWSAGIIRDHSHITFIQGRGGGSGKIWQLHNGKGVGHQKYDGMLLLLELIGNFNPLLHYLLTFTTLLLRLLRWFLAWIHSLNLFAD